MNNSYKALSLSSLLTPTNTKTTEEEVSLLGADFMLSGSEFWEFGGIENPRFVPLFPLWVSQIRFFHFFLVKILFRFFGNVLTLFELRSVLYFVLCVCYSGFCIGLFELSFYFDLNFEDLFALLHLNPYIQIYFTFVFWK